jgi:hypothetical protein
MVAYEAGVIARLVISAETASFVMTSSSCGARWTYVIVHAEWRADRGVVWLTVSMAASGSNDRLTNGGELRYVREVMPTEF